MGKYIANHSTTFTATDTSPSDLSKYIAASHTVLTPSNYNEVDALVFAQLSYYRFEDAFSSVRVASDENPYIFQYPKVLLVPAYADALLSYRPQPPADDYDFLKQLSHSLRYKHCTAKNFSIADERCSQWAALTIRIDSATSVLVYRGTDGTSQGWTEDFALAHEEKGTYAQLYSYKYLKQCPAPSIFLAGHSKGGNNAIFAYLISAAQKRQKVLRIDNFDGPGMNDELVRAYPAAYEELRTKLTNYYPKDSVIGLLLNDNPGENHYVDTIVRSRYKNSGIMGEHDPFSWQIDGGRFKPAKQSKFSQSLNSILDNTIKGLSHSDRETLIHALEDMGIPSFIAKKNKNFSLRKFIRTCHRLSLRKKKALLATLIRFGCQIAR